MTRAVILRFPSRSRQPMAGRMEPESWPWWLRMLPSLIVSIAFWGLVIWAFQTWGPR